MPKTKTIYYFILAWKKTLKRMQVWAYILLNENYENSQYIYSPDITNPNEEREQFFEEIQDVLDKFQNTEEIILTGDFNSELKTI